MSSPTERLCGWFVVTVATCSLLETLITVNFLGNEPPSSGNVEITFGEDEWNGWTLWSGFVFAFMWNLTLSLTIPLLLFSKSIIVLFAKLSVVIFPFMSTGT